MELPPKAFYKILVKADSQYGVTVSVFLPKDLSAKLLITLPNTDSD